MCPRFLRMWIITYICKQGVKLQEEHRSDKVSVGATCETYDTRADLHIVHRVIDSLDHFQSSLYFWLKYDLGQKYYTTQI